MVSYCFDPAQFRRHLAVARQRVENSMHIIFYYDIQFITLACDKENIADFYKSLKCLPKCTKILLLFFTMDIEKDHAVFGYHSIIKESGNLKISNYLTNYLCYSNTHFIRFL